MAAAQLHERVHYRHDTRWLLEDGDKCLCLACVIEMMEDESVSVVRKKHMLSSFQIFLEKKSSTVYTFLGQDGRICAYFVGQMLGMLVNLEADSTLDLISEILVQLILGFKLEQFVHYVLDGCIKELSEVACLRLCLPILNFLGKLVDAMPSVSEIIATDHYKIVEQLPQGLMYPNEVLKASVCYLYGKLYSSSAAALKLTDHFTNTLCELFLATLENAQTKELQINCMGLLKQLLKFDQFVSVIMNASTFNEDLENTPTLHAQMTLPFLLRKILLSREEFLQIASAQCIAAVLVHFQAKYAPSFILIDIPEFLFENLLCTSEVLIWSIYSCLILMTEERIFFTKCHTVYGIEAVLKSLKYVLQLNNMELQKQGLLLLTEILKRQPSEINLFTSTGIFKAATDVLQEAVSSSILEVAIEASKAMSSFLRKDHLSIPVQYGELEKLLNRMMERCSELSFTSLKRKSSKNLSKKEQNKSISRQGQFLTNVLECFHNACRLALDCKDYHIAHDNAFTAPSSKSTSTLQTFSLYLLKACDNFCIPLVLRYCEWTAVPATLERFFLFLMDMFAVLPNMKETFAVKLASASIIRFAMETKSTLCSVRRNANLNNACSDFLCHLCSIVWDVKSTNEVNSQTDVSFSTEVFDILKKSMIHIEGSVEGFISILLESPNTETEREILRYKQQALLIVACVAYLMEDRFISETDLWWTVQSFLHSLQSSGEKVPLFIIRAILYLLARSQDKCEALNIISVTMICKMLEDVPEVQDVYFHHPQFLKFFFKYPQLMEKYGYLIMKCWIHQEYFNKNESKTIVTKLNPAVQQMSMPITSIFHYCPQAILILLDLMVSGSEDLADKVFLILKAFLDEMDSFETSNLILDKVLQIFQDALVSSDLQEKVLPSVLSLLCLLQKKKQPKIVLDGSYFKLFYSVNNISGKCSLSSENILQPALNFLYCSIHYTGTASKVRATAVLLSNTCLIEMLEEMIAKTLDTTQSHCSDSLYCSAWLMTSTLMNFQQCYNLQIHKTIYVDVKNVIDLISFKCKDTSSMLIVSILQHLKAQLRQKFSSPFIKISKGDRNHPVPEPQDDIWPLTSKSTLYLVAALQNLLVQKDTILVQVAADCFGSIVDFLHDKAPDLAHHVASQPWNRFVLLVSLTGKTNGYLQPGVLRLLSLFVKYGTLNILTLNEIDEIIDDAVHVKITDLPQTVLLDLQTFLLQLQNKQILNVPHKNAVIEELLKNINSISNDSVTPPILYVDGTAICLTHLVE
ncbi:meiosis inhibitor protein 1 isoform X2 [Engystomops pustulosus]|uniref:meiosis inhibitor protein 1 isoform X2 n=1 Tax=Engystomops pustulosus TaxID=76066 RepID=UPI003AFB5DB8